MTTFLPKGYENLRTEKSYWKMSQMKEGENRLRIVGQPIAGWLDWHDKKPMRFPPDKKPLYPYDLEKPIKAFWALHVWDYARESLFILEITQSSILKSLTKIANDEDWGDFTKYDIKMSKEGTGKETRYSLTPLPHKPLSDKIQNAVENTKIRLEALYEGKDPWTDLVSSVDYSTGEINQESIHDSPLETLKDILAMDNIEEKYLDEYLATISRNKKQPVEVVIQSALLPEAVEKFKAHYQKFINSLVSTEKMAV